MAKFHQMDLETYFDRFGLDVDELAVALMRRLEYLDDIRKRELFVLLQDHVKLEGQAETVKQKLDSNPMTMLTLVEEASANLNVAKKLRESVVNSKGDIIGSITDVQKALQASDRCLDTASKRWTDIYNTSTAIALEEAVKETIRGLSEEAYIDFIADLEEKLAEIR